MSHGTAGQMTQSLLLVAWPYKDEILYSFRFATVWQMPTLYTGNAKLTQIYSYVNDSQFEMVYRCQNCFSWNVGPSITSVSSSAGLFVLGRAQGAAPPDAPSCPDKIRFGFHDAGYGQYGANLTGAANPSYSAWAALATKTASTDGANIPTFATSTTATSTSATA